MVHINSFPGLMTNVDPHNLPLGAATIQHNCRSTKRGALVVRKGFKDYVGAAVFGSSVYYFRSNGDPYLVWQSGSVVSVGAVKASGSSIETGVSQAVPSHWCNSRTGSLIRVNGAARGSIWLDSGESAAVALGITAPTEVPTVQQDPDAGAAQPARYAFGFRYLDAFDNPSSLSPLTYIEADSSDGFDWGRLQASAESRVTHFQLFRSTADQEDVLYLVTEQAKAGLGYYSDDDLSDDDLVANADVILPIFNMDRTLSARRFEPPPTFMSVVVAFQDRYWYAVAYDEPEEENSIYYSYAGEPESVPPVQNVLHLSQDTADNDRVRALIPWGQVLYVLKDRHTYRYSFAGDPGYGSAAHLVYARGCLNQRCFAFLEADCYLFDQMGFWRMGREGPEAIDEAIRDIFAPGIINWTLSHKFLVFTEPNERIVRFHLAYTEDGGAVPERIFAYDPATKAWHTEGYPYGTIVGVEQIEYDGGLRTVMATGGKLRLLAEETDDDGEEIEWQYRTGLIEIPIDGDADAQMHLIYQPTSGTETFTLKLYEDHDTDAVVYSIGHQEGGASVAAASSDVSIEMKADRSVLGGAPGLARWPLHVRADRRAISRRFLSVDLSGSQEAEEIKIYGLKLGEPS